MNLTSSAVGLGLFVSAIALFITVIRQRRLESRDVGPLAVAFLSGTNIPPALFLCGYGIWPDPVAVATKLHGLEKYVSFAGFCLFVVSVISISSVFQAASLAAVPAPPNTHEEEAGAV